MARGVRTLLSILPGSKLKGGIADFKFRSMGVTDDVTVLDPKTCSVTGTKYVIGLTALFHLALKDIMIDSFSHGTRLNAADWVTNFEGGRLLSLEIVVIPQARLSQRQGQLAVAFIPFRSKEEVDYYNKTKQGMSYEQVKLIPGSKSASALQTIRLSFTPRASDGRLFFDIGLNDQIGAVSIGFEQTNRISYGRFPLDVFSCTVTVSGVVELQRPHEVPYASKFARKLDDKLSHVDAVMMTVDRSVLFNVYKPSRLEVVPSTSSTRVGFSGIVDREVCDILRMRASRDMTLG